MDLKRTPFYGRHTNSDGKMVSFAGWELPIQYTGIIEEHMAVRNSAGLFDVSHMGDIIIRGSGARDFLSKVLTNNVDLAVPGKGVYSHILNDDGGIIDDTIIYNLGEDGYLLVPNASTKDTVLSWFNSKKTDDVEIIDISSKVACLALQGPKAVDIAQRITDDDLTSIRRYGIISASVRSKTASEFLPEYLTIGKGKGLMCLFARSGYTGEDGFEILVEWDSAPALWDALISAGSNDLVLCGLGCRDTLRLEKGMLLSGTDFNGTQTSVQTGPGWVVKYDHDFIGRNVLEKQKESGEHNVLVAMTVEGKGIPRHGCSVKIDGKTVGIVTSGSISPISKKGMALGYVPKLMSETGTTVVIDIRGNPAIAKIVKLPFV